MLSQGTPKFITKEYQKTMMEKNSSGSESEDSNNRSDGLVVFGNRGRVFGVNELLGSEAEILGKGTFWTSYKAYLVDGDAVVVKRFKVPCDFAKDKLQKLGQMVHPNLIPIRAYFFSQSEKLLIRDYMPVGSLSHHLHGHGGKNKTPLDWQDRYRIAYGVACGIEYLHSQCPIVCHGNLRSSNILLTSGIDAHLSDFSIAQLLSPNSKLNYVAGYRAPEVTNVHQVSQKSDVYSFGVLLLELLTGKAPMGDFDLPKWVRSMCQEKPIIDVFDQKLLRQQENIEEQMFQFLQLAICCTFEYPNNRPLIADVANRIKGICKPELG
ncbi:hypothetical protein CsSME_00022640 [Camellia sinensis var. sinensis]